VRGFLDELRHPGELLLKPRNEVGGPILKENDEAESEKHKQHNPEQTSNETHAPTLTDWLPAVNDGNAASSADAA